MGSVEDVTEKIYILFPDGLWLWGRWNTLELRSLMGQLALVQQRTSKTQMLLNSGLTSMTTSMLLSLQTRYLIISFLYVNQNCRLFDKGNRYWKFNWQPNIYPDDTNESGNPGQSPVCFVFLWNFKQRWRADLPSLYWIPNLYKYPYKQNYFADSVKCPTKHLSNLLTSILSMDKTELQNYCDTSC